MIYKGERWLYANATGLNNLYPLAKYPHHVPAHLQNAQIQQRMLQLQMQLEQRKRLVVPDLFLIVHLFIISFYLFLSI